MKSENTIVKGIQVIKSAKIGQRLDVVGSAAVGGNMKVAGWLDAPNLRGMCVGLFANEDALKSVYPRPRPGMYALIGDTVPAAVWRADKDGWVATGETGGDSTIDFSDFEELKDTVAALEMANVKRISVDDFNAFPVDTDAIKSAMYEPSRWQILIADNTSYVIGLCDVFFDGMAHTIVEILTTQHSISDEELQGSVHTDGVVCTYMRVYNTAAGTLSNDVGTWTEWKLVNMVTLGATDDDDDDDSTTTTVDNTTLLTVVNKYSTLYSSIEVLSESLQTIQASLDNFAVISTEELGFLCTFDD